MKKKKIAWDAANDDWLRALRLQKKAEAGDKEAEAKLKELKSTRLVTYDELVEMERNKKKDSE